MNRFFVRMQMIGCLGLAMFAATVALATPPNLLEVELVRVIRNLSGRFNECVPSLASTAREASILALYRLRPNCISELTSDAGTAAQAAPDDSEKVRVLVETLRRYQRQIGECSHDTALNFREEELAMYWPSGVPSLECVETRIQRRMRRPSSSLEPEKRGAK